MLGPNIRGQKIHLEPVKHDDLDIFRSWFADEQVTRYLLRRFVPGEKAEEEWFERASSAEDVVCWSIVHDGKTIGNTAIVAIDWINRHAITGLIIGDTSQWGQGIASETVRLRTHFAFQELNLERLESESYEANVAMHRALEKSGYQKVGRRRHQMFREGAWHDTFIFEVLRDGWLAERA